MDEQDEVRPLADDLADVGRGHPRDEAGDPGTQAGLEDVAPAERLEPGARPGRVAPPTFVGRIDIKTGVVHDPAGGDPGEVEQAWVVAALDRSLSGPKPYGEPPRTVGRLEAIAVASGAGREPRLLDRVRAIPGHGLEGDRYSTGDGTFSGGTGDGRALTLIEAEVLDSLALPGGAPLGAVDARRNLVTRGVPLNALVGRRFTVGEVECEGRRLCEPCAHLERLTQPGVLRGLVHRGGLRADILSAGTIEVGAAVRPLD